MALVHGTFANGIPYLRFGIGPKTMLFLAGGPGNLVPSGVGASGFTRGMRPFTDEYTIHLVTRKSGLRDGYTTKDMSDDYAELIEAEFGGHVDLVMGVSYGGLIAQYLAADHPGLFDHRVIVMAAHVVSDEAKRIDVRYAQLIRDGKDRDAMALRADAAFTGVTRSVMAGLLWLFGKPLLGRIDDTFRRDVLIEAEAEVSHDSTASLGAIAAPVLIVGGTDDIAFPRGVMEEMARLVPGAELKVYEGGHTAAFLDKRFAGDVHEFVRSRPTGPAGGYTSAPRPGSST
jgi:pimeloyl-ACP methyl ester carboxylesterase